MQRVPIWFKYNCSDKKLFWFQDRVSEQNFVPWHHGICQLDDGSFMDDDTKEADPTWTVCKRSNDFYFKNKKDDLMSFYYKSAKEYSGEAKWQCVLTEQVDNSGETKLRPFLYRDPQNKKEFLVQDVGTERTNWNPFFYEGHKYWVNVSKTVFWVIRTYGDYFGEHDVEYVDLHALD